MEDDSGKKNSTQSAVVFIKNPTSSSFLFFPEDERSSCSCTKRRRPLFGYYGKSKISKKQEQNNLLLLFCTVASHSKGKSKLASFVLPSKNWKRTNAYPAYHSKPTKREGKKNTQYPLGEKKKYERCERNIGPFFCCCDKYTRLF